MIYDISPVSNYLGNNTSVKFDFDFLIQSKNQLKVTMFDEASVAHQLICDIDYSINEIGNDKGSYIVFPIEGSNYSILTDKQKISLELVLPIEQLSQFDISSNMYYSEIESSFDYLTRLIQILKRKIELCVSVTEGSNYSPDELMKMINDAKISAQSFADTALKYSGIAKEYAGVANNASLSSQESSVLAQEAKNELVKNNMFKYWLFDFKVSDHILEGTEAKGWALQGTYVTKDLYPDFYNECLKQKNDANIVEAILGNSALTMYVNSNGHQFYDIANKTIVDEFYNTFGIADFYGIDEENERVFLPRNKYFYQLTDDVSKVNNTIEAGLPNIMGEMNDNGAVGVYGGVGVSGAFTNSRTSHSSVGLTSASSILTVFDFDASKSSPIYGNSDTVQPPSSLKLLYYCVGNTVVNEAKIDAGALVSQMEQKANIFLDNVLPSSDFKNQITSYCCPDWNNGIVNEALTFTAPTLGWYYYNKNVRGNVNITLFVNGVKVAFGRPSGADFDIELTGSVLLNKGDYVEINGSNYDATRDSFIFFPLKGAN